ncbi:hypothetical protein DTO207G8_1452 [Paecilomyces variotii]|nr:hypothetical protein DTO169E5_5345 [Paecilomyces variotii]KAJ9258277.1 hypothetical protein DTO207G8_1452 [Paecilomyces variotii]KAJ9392981.1 hypothetical protein DTO063F5_118 [Paecilomyces variotii]
MSSLLSFAGWAVLPNYATSFLQSVYYGLTIRAGEPRPQPPSPRYERHRRRIFILVVTSYLLYTLYETFFQVRQAGDFYRVLGVSPLADEKTIKSRFRRLAAQHHPDKLQHADGMSAAGSEAFFVYLKLAQDTLVDPVRRFAYDRFGPEIVQGKERKTIQEYAFAALYGLLPQYVVGAAMLVFMSVAWWSSWGRYWRFYSFALLVTLEIALVTHPSAILMPASFLPPGFRSLLGIFVDQPGFYLLPFQILTLARRASVTLHIFISQISPPEPKASPASAGLKPRTVQQLGQLQQLSRVTDAEATRLLQLGFAPYRGDKESVATLRRGMKEGLVLGAVRQSPEVKEAIQQVIEKRKREAHRDE